MSTYYVAGLPCSNELYHHGILGQKWGVRRFQNPDGSLTSAGRARYGGSSESTATKAKKALKSAGQSVGRTAKSAANYAATRTKMKHPSMMSDEDLRKYTQRLIAEKNYSDLMRYQRSNSGVGRAKQYVGEILKRGGQTLADAGFRKMANAITKTKDERALDKLKAELDQQNIKDKIQDHERQRQIDMLTQQNKIGDLQEQLTDPDGKQAQQKEIEKLQREQQLNNLRNNLDTANVQMQQQINQLQQQKTLRDLQKQLDPNQNGGGLSAAMRIIGDPNASANQIQEAKQVLQNYNLAQNFMNQIAERGNGIPFAASQVANSTAAAGSQSPENIGDESRWFPTQYGQTRYHSEGIPGATVHNQAQDFSNYRMNSVDGTGGGMYGGRIADSRIPTVENMSDPYRAPAASNRGMTTSRVVTPAAPKFTNEDWYREFLERSKDGGVVRKRS